MWKGKALAVAILLAVTLGAPAGSEAEESCDAIVHDAAEAFGASEGRVREAAERLTALGAEVRVRVSRTLEGSETVEAFEEAFEKRCGSWRTPDGRSRKNNLIALLVATSARKSAIFYGAQWNPSLGTNSNWSRIRTDFMNPRFRDGDWAGGMVNALNEISRLVNLQIHPPAPQPQAPVVVQRSKPIDLSGLWHVLGWVVALIALAAVAWAGWFVCRWRAKVRAARQKARLAKQDTASRINRLGDELQTLEVSVSGLAGEISGEVEALLREELAGVNAAYDAATEDYSGLGKATNDPDRPRLSEAEYEQTSESYGKLLEQVRGVVGLKNALEQKIASIRNSMDESRATITAASVELTTAAAEVARVRGIGFKTLSADKALEKAQASLREANLCIQNKRFDLALASAVDSRKLAAEAIDASSRLPAVKGETEAAVSALANRIEHVKSAIVEGRRVFERVSQRYARSSWESIRGNGTEATNRVNWALNAIGTAGIPSLIETQEWTRAQEGVREANRWLDEAESCMRSYVERERHLALAEHDAPQEVKSAGADIAKAWEYVRAHADDILDVHETDLHAAEDLLEEIKRDLMGEKPDFPRALKTVRVIRACSDGILAVGRAEHEAAERLREKAESTLRDARRAVSKAREFFEDHPTCVRENARALLTAAETNLKAAEEASVSSVAISNGERALSQGNEAYAMVEVEATVQTEGGGPVWGSSRGEPGPNRGDSGGGWTWIYYGRDTVSDSGETGWRSDSGGGGSWGSDSGGGGGSWGSDAGGGGGGDFGGGGGGGGDF